METKRLVNIRRNLKIIGFLLFHLNLPKTFWINFKLLPFKSACKFPIFIFGKARIQLKGEFIIDCKIKPGLLKFGYKYEMEKRELGVAEFLLSGTFILKGETWFGMDCFLFIDEGATLVMGNFSSLGCRGRLICTSEIVFSDYTRIGYESVISDSNFHYIKDLKTNLIQNYSGSIFLGAYNYIGGRVLIHKNTITPDYCIVAANSICNKDYTLFVAENSMIGGMPAKLLKDNCVRIFDINKEKQIFEYFKMTNSLEYLDV